MGDFRKHILQTNFKREKLIPTMKKKKILSLLIILIPIIEFINGISNTSLHVFGVF